MVKSRNTQAAARWILGGALIVAAGSGCATKGFVRTEVAKANQHTDMSIQAAKTELESDIGQAQSRADQAMEKATLAERLASGTLRYDVVSTHQVQFEFDDWNLDDGAQTVLNNLGTSLTSHPRYVLEIRGYADATGPDRYNYQLGRERAESVQRFLMMQYSVPAGRIAIVTFGEEEPLADNGTTDGRAENRRVQVRLLDVMPQQSEPLAMTDG